MWEVRQVCKIKDYKEDEECTPIYEDTLTEQHILDIGRIRSIQVVAIVTKRYETSYEPHIWDRHFCGSYKTLDEAKKRAVIEIKKYFNVIEQEVNKMKEVVNGL